MIRERELRLALVCYGGVSLAIYMHGVTKELWKLLRASEARKCNRELEGDTELVWLDLMHTIAHHADLTVICDVLAGASAGGLNAVLLSDAITGGHSLEPLTDMWLDEADVDKLLDPEARPSGRLAERLGRFYKEPIAWLAAHQSESLASVDNPDVRAEIAVKLAGFVRSRWFKPPFSGEGLTAMLDTAMDAMEAASTGRPLIPPALPLSLFVTVTDYWGANVQLPIHSPPTVTEREHRRIFAFQSPPIAMHDPAPRLPAAERPALLFAARATACFPGAFPPASITEIDDRLAETGRVWPHRARFIATQLAGDRSPEDILLIDGSVLDNAPFGPAIEAVRVRVAHREVDRRFVYVDPKPGAAGPLRGLSNREPGFFTAIYRALADIPRAQPIRDSLESIRQLSAHIRRISDVVDAMTPAVDEAILRAVGTHFFLWPLGNERLARARARLHSAAALGAGYTFAGYAQMKVRTVLDEATRLLRHQANLNDNEETLLRQMLTDVLTERQAFDHRGALGRNPAQSGYVQFLRHHDISFRIRRLRLFSRRLVETIESSASEAERAAAEKLKAAMYRAVSPFEELRSPAPTAPTPAAEAVRRTLSESNPEQRRRAAADALDQLAAMHRLSAQDSEVDQMLAMHITNPAFSRPARQRLVRAWLGFPFYDIAILPMMQVQTADSFEELKVDRISPDDAISLREGGARACLKGWQMNAFAGFFSRAYRENDYLFGRLHAAERFLDIVLTAVPECQIDARYWKGRLFAAILASERSRLGHIGNEIDDLEAKLALWQAANGNSGPDGEATASA